MKNWKTTLLGLIVATALSLVAIGAPALAWDASPPAEGVKGYQVSRVVDGELKPFAKVATNSCLLEGLAPGIHTFVVTALNEWESAPSAPVSTHAVPLAPAGVKITVDIQVNVRLNGAPVAK